MIELEKHITKLLLSNDCVIVPNFGGFVAHHIDASYDAEDSLFYPPLRTVGFNQQLKINDSLLVQSFVEEYDMSYPEALTHIEKDVEEMKERLESDGRYDMHDLGMLRLGNEGSYDFEPCEAGILTPTLYGLSTYGFAPVVKAAEEKPSESPSMEAEKRETTDKAIAVDDKAELEDKDYIRISYSTLRYMAAACLLFAAFLLFPSKMGDNNSFSLQQSKIDTGAILNILTKGDDAIAAKPVPAQRKNAVGTSTEKEESQAQPEEKDVAADNAPSEYYTIVLASKVSYKNANAFVERLHGAGYAEAEVLPSGKYAKVIYKQYATEGEAYAELRKVTDNEKLADAWVTKIKERK